MTTHPMMMLPAAMETSTKERRSSSRSSILHRLFITAALFLVVTAVVPPGAVGFTSYAPPPLPTRRSRRKAVLQKSSHHHWPLSSSSSLQQQAFEAAEEEETVDIAIVGAGIGGLCAGAILNTLYNKKVGIYESHYLAGGCAHAFERVAAISTTATTTNTADETSDNEQQQHQQKKKKIAFTFDSGPTIVLGCSKEPYNPLQQVLRAVGVEDQVEWIPYDGWGMIEHPSNTKKEKRWKLLVGPNHFENGPLKQFASSTYDDDDDNDAIRQFNELREITKPLVTGAATIPALAMRPGSTALIPLLRYLPSLISIISNGVEASTGPFGPYINGPIYKVTNPWLRDWLDALAFSLSGLPADRTSAGAMAYVLFDMHREGAALDYPRGGLGNVVKALVNGVEQPTKKSGKILGSKVNLRHHVESIDTTEDGTRVTGLTVRKLGGKMVRVKAKEGVICNAPMWSLRKLIKNEKALDILSGGGGDDAVVNKQSGGGGGGGSSVAAQSWITDSDIDPKTGRGSVIRPARQQPNEETMSVAAAAATDNLLAKCDNAEMTGSFLHLHVALDAKDLDLDSLEPHYTVMDRGLEGDDRVINGVPDGPCGELNMIAVSNPCVLDRTLAPEGYIVVHAYGAGNEPYDIWKSKSNDETTSTTTSSGGEETDTDDSGDRYQSSTYNALKDARGEALWRAIESIIPDARERTVLALLGSPLTHERYLRRPYGSYGAAFEDCLKDGSTPIPNLMLAGDGVFPGIGIPAVALSGASAANGMVKVIEQWRCLDDLKSQKIIS
jgi:phytoene dehydrogenase-like protein